MQEFDEYTIHKPKAVSSLFKPFKVAEKTKEDQEKFEYWINQTAILLFGEKDGKPPKGTYMSVFRMTKKWSLDKIIERYQVATKHHGSISPSHKWWAERKKDLNGGKSR